MAIIGCKSHGNQSKFTEPRQEKGETHTHVGGDEHPLRQFVVVQVFIEHGEVLRFSKAVGIRCH